MSDRYDEMSVPPDHSQAEALRQRLHARIASVSRDEHHAGPLLHLDTELLGPDERDPIKEMNVSLNTPTGESGNRRRLLTVAAAVVVVIGVAGIVLANNNTDDDDTPLPPAVATIDPTTTVAARTETLSFGVTSANIPVTLTAPVYWTVDEGWAVHRPGSAGVLFEDLANIYADGCQRTLVDPPVGPTVDDFVAAWANLPEFAATEAVDVTVDGYAGKQIEFTVPDYTLSECKGNLFALWYADGDAAPGFWAQAAQAAEPTADPRRRRHPPRDHRVVPADYIAAGPSRARGDLVASIEIG